MLDVVREARSVLEGGGTCFRPPSFGGLLNPRFPPPRAAPTGTFTRYVWGGTTCSACAREARWGHVGNILREELALSNPRGHSWHSEAKP